MRKLLLIAAALFAFATTVEAQNYQNRGQGYNRGGGYAHGYNRGGNYYRNNGNRYVQNNYYGRRGGWNNNGAAWAAGLGGLAAGALIGGVLANQYYAAPQPVYPASPVYPGCTQTSFYNQYGQRVVQTTCP